MLKINKLKPTCFFNHSYLDHCCNIKPEYIMIYLDCKTVP